MEAGAEAQPTQTRVVANQTRTSREAAAAALTSKTRIKTKIRTARITRRTNAAAAVVRIGSTTAITSKAVVVPAEIARIRTIRMETMLVVMVRTTNSSTEVPAETSSITVETSTSEEAPAETICSAVDPVAQETGEETVA